MKLGLIGGTGPESTVIYYQGLCRKVEERTGSLPSLTIESLSVFKVLAFCSDRDWDGLCAYLLKGLESLKGAGCDEAALTGMTPHIVFPALSARSPIPLVSMIDTSLSFIRSRGWNKVGLLGTGVTMSEPFFQDAVRGQGVDVAVPDQETQAWIADKISSELEYGIVTEETRSSFLSLVDRMEREEGIEAVVLGCTELPLVFNQARGLPVVDVLQVHLDALSARLCLTSGRNG